MPAPTPPSDDAVKQMIINEIGDPNNTILASINDVWNRYLIIADGNQLLTSLYTKRACIDLRLAEEQSATDIEIGDDWSDKQSGRFDHLVTMRSETHEELLRLIRIARVSRVPQMAAITKTAPTAPPFGGPDSTDDRYRGSPYYGRDRWS